MSDTKVWVALEGGRIELVDTTPLPPERFGNGHFWMFDHFTSDMDDPYSCGLCGEAKWKVYDAPCEHGRTPDDLNAERAQWIEEHRHVGEIDWLIRRRVAVAA